MLLCSFICVFCSTQNIDTKEQNQVLLYYDHETAKYDTYKKAFEKSLINSNKQKDYYRIDLTRSFPYDVKYEKEYKAKNSHNDIVFEKIYNRQIHKLYKMENDKDVNKDTLLYNNIRLEFIEQVMDSETINNIAVRDEVYGAIDMQKIYKKLVKHKDTDIYKLGLSAIARDYTHQHLTTNVLPKYCFYSPFALGFLINFDFFMKDKILLYKNEDNCKVFEILYLHCLLEYFYCANENILEKYNEQMAVNRCNEIQKIYHRFDFMLRDPTFYKVMILVYNIEVLQNFICPQLYKLLTNITNHTTHIIYQTDFYNNLDILICYYITMFSLFFVDEANVQMLSSYKHRYMNCKDFFVKIEEHLITEKGYEHFLESLKFSNFFKHILHTKIIAFLKRYSTKRQNYNYVSLLENLLNNCITKEQEHLLHMVQIDNITGDFCYKTMPYKNYIRNKLDMTFYKLFTHILFEVLLHNMVEVKQ
ncbi:hypothetical protein BDAP_001980 [Binucleata daphniae]